MIVDLDIAIASAALDEQPHRRLAVGGSANRRLDPLDALVVARSPIVAGAVVKCRPIGVLLMEDDAGGDEKLLCVPVNKTFPYYADVASYTDMPPIVLQQIEHFFTHYKDLEPGKWAKLNGWGDVDEAKRIIVECIERAKATGY